MGTFELERERGAEARRLEGERGFEDVAAAQTDRRRIKQECIIALKVYDHCRQPDGILQQKRKERVVFSLF